MAGLLVALCALAALGPGRLFDEPVAPPAFAWTALALLRRESRMDRLALRCCCGRPAPTSARRQPDPVRAP